MKKIQIYVKLIFFLFIIFLISNCKKEELAPVNIFETQELAEDAHGIILNGFPNADAVYFNEGTYEETENGYHVKGTLFAKNEESKLKHGISTAEGALAVAGGEFDIDFDKGTGTVTVFAGKGAPFLPNDGIFGYIKNDLIPSVDFMYETGKKIKEQPGKNTLPLQDDICYYGFESNNYDKWDASIPIGAINILPKALYLDPSDPMFYAQADVGTEKFTLEDARVGVSANGLLNFTPYELNPEMEEICGGFAFEPFNGHLLIGAKVPLDDLFKIPAAVDGEIVIKTGETGNEMDYFNNLDEANFEIGVNGKVILTHEALSFLPAGVEFVLGRAILQYKHGTDDDFMAIAGQIETERDFNFILDYIPDPVKDLFPLEEAFEAYSNSQEDHKGVYLEIRSATDWKFFFETKSGMKLPGLTLNENQVILGVSPSGVSFMAKNDALPFGLASAKFIGEIDFDGHFYMKTSQESSFPELIDGLSFEFRRTLEASNMDFTGVKVSGDYVLPFGIGEVHVLGEITTECMAVTGTMNSQIDFGGGVEFPTVDMLVDISTCRGIKINGTLDVPYGIAYVNVEGEITSRGLGLMGMFSSDINFGGGVSLPAVDMILSANTWDGVYLRGVLDVPYNIAYVEVEGQFNTSGLTVAGYFSTDIDFGGGFELPSINMQLSASTDPNEGIAFNGKMEIPANIGQISVEGRLSINDLYFSGNYNAGLDLGFTTLGSELFIEISTGGIQMAGKQEFPFGFGGIDVSGEIYSNGSFSLSGAYKFGFDFGIIELEAGFKVKVTNTYIDMEAYGKGTIDFGLFETTFSMGIGINPNWGSGTCELCIDFSLGDACITIPDKDKMKRIGPMTMQEFEALKNDALANPEVKRYK